MNHGSCGHKHSEFTNISTILSRQLDSKNLSPVRYHLKVASNKLLSNFWRSTFFNNGFQQLILCLVFEVASIFILATLSERPKEKHPWPSRASISSVLHRNRVYMKLGWRQRGCGAASDCSLSVYSWGLQILQRFIHTVSAQCWSVILWAWWMVCSIHFLALASPLKAIHVSKGACAAVLLCMCARVVKSKWQRPRLILHVKIKTAPAWVL